MAENVQSYYRMRDTVITKSDYAYHSHDRFEIYYFHGGSCRYLISDNIYDLQDDDIIIMNGMTLHRANPEIGTTYERSVIEFSAEWVTPILVNLNVPEILTPFTKLSNTLFRGVDKETLDEIKELFRKISLINESPPSNDRYKNRLKEGQITVLLVQLLFIIYDLSKLRLVKLPSKRTEKNIHVNRIVSWIDENFKNDITLDSIADSLNISKYYMSRIFKDVTGYTIMQYLMSCRFNRAKYLLEMYPDKTILEVALESGFDNCSHFSRFFKKQLNITPSEYRNRRSNKYNSCSASQ
ncbi:AraC family transcriptional regulator [Aquibacillus salsiterrae]|uniref:AraC family transcriptional regulator n=1 Tax=Aquibacillus salsiterrae TaxID=2950439 RepID=A0A9X3WBD5_9BACI|nr:AraC family transcriptional regulator [Aquibacillus salsiterrae]MDC3416037.1 AraC family transcriptional regulator [Aquibacillus salsiterrae]